MDRYRSARSFASGFHEIALLHQFRLSLIFVLRRGSVEERTFSVANVACRSARKLI